jgi:hypothetical protein
MLKLQAALPDVYGLFQDTITGSETALEIVDGVHTRQGMGE